MTSEPLHAWVRAEFVDQKTLFALVNVILTLRTFPLDHGPSTSHYAES